MLMIIIPVVWIIVTFKSYKRLGDEFRLSKALLPLILITLIASISLRAKYTYIHPDGIATTGLVKWIIIQDDHWTRELIGSYFRNSVILNLILISVYLVLKFFKK